MIKTTLKIAGMMCGMCEAHINGAIRGAFKVNKVTSSHKKGLTEIVSENAFDESALAECIEKTGYKLVSISSKDYVRKGVFGR